MKWLAPNKQNLLQGLLKGFLVGKGNNGEVEWQLHTKRHLGVKVVSSQIVLCLHTCNYKHHTSSYGKQSVSIGADGNKTLVFK